MTTATPTDNPVIVPKKLPFLESICWQTADDSVEARDLIDLAVLRLRSPIPQASIEKAEKAYQVMRPLERAIALFQGRPDYREKCFLGLQVDQTQIPKIIDGIDLLSTDLGLSHTPRVFREQHNIFADLETQKEKPEDF